MRPVPKVNILQEEGGTIEFLPTIEELPVAYLGNQRTPSKAIIAKFYYRGVTKGELEEWVPRAGVDAPMAIKAIQATLRAAVPEGIKLPGASFLWDEWFEHQPSGWTPTTRKLILPEGF